MPLGQFFACPPLVGYNKTIINMAAKNRFKDKFSDGKIATGKFYTPGSFSSRSRRGLAGALRKARSAGKYSYTQNLSKENLKIFQKLLGEELSKLSTTSAGL